MITVFKTDVQEDAHAAHLVAMLLRHFPGSRINFDLDDCDKILRIDSAECPVKQATSLMQAQGFNCMELQ